MEAHLDEEDFTKNDKVHMDFCLIYISEDVTKTKHERTKQPQQTKISEEQEIFIMSNLTPQLCYHLWMLECNIFI